MYSTLKMTKKSSKTYQPFMNCNMMLPCVFCLSVCMCALVHTSRGQRRMSAFFLYCSPLIPLMLTESKRQDINWAVRPVRAREQRKSLCSSTLELQTHAAMPDFLLGAGDLISVPHVCIANSLSPEPSPWAFVLYFLCLAYLGSPCCNEVALSPTMHGVLISTWFQHFIKTIVIMMMPGW